MIGMIDSFGSVEVVRCLPLILLSLALPPRTLKGVSMLFGAVGVIISKGILLFKGYHFF